MGKDRFSRLTDGQRECLRLYHAGYQIKQIASDLGLAQSTVNARLERARNTLGATSSREAARLLAVHEGETPPESTWIPPTGSWNPIHNPPDSAADVADHSEVDGHKETDQEDSVAFTGPAQPGIQMQHHASVRWPFSTPGRTENDIRPIARLAWVPPAALVSLVIMALLVLLGVALQDILASAHQSLARIF